MFAYNVTALSALASIALLLTGYLSSKNKSYNELTDPCIFFGSFILAVAVNLLFGMQVTLLVVGIPSVIIASYYWKYSTNKDSYQQCHDWP